MNRLEGDLELNTDEEEIAQRNFERFASGKFLRLVQEEWKTPNWSDFFVWRDESEALGGGFVAGVVSFDCIHNTYIPDKINREFCIHIAMVGIAENFRKCGFLGYVCSRIIHWADEAGVFVYGHARGFNYPVPTLRNVEDSLEWLEHRDDTVPHFLHPKMDLAQSKTLHQKYIEYGFSRYDGAGMRFGNRKWKKMCFGHLGENCKNDWLRDFVGNHLRTC